ncbi:MAG: ABC transporter permease [Thermomicrobiales bacterium]
MTTMFGVSMSTIAVVMLALMGACLLGVGFIAWRNRTMFWLGVRNLPRRKAQTVLIVFGLMLATLIIASALTIGDTLTYSLKKVVYDRAGTIDLLIQPGALQNGQIVRNPLEDSWFDASVAGNVQAKIAGNPAVTALAPAVVAPVALLDETTKQAEPMVDVIGLDPHDAAAFGGVPAHGGGTVDLAALKAGEIAVNQTLADSIQGKPGDKLTIYTHGAPQTFTIARIAGNAGLGGGIADNGKAVILSLPAARTLIGPEAAGKYNAMVASAPGGVQGSIKNIPAAKDALTAATAGTGLVVDPFKQDAMNQSEQIGNLFTSFFLVFGLFAIAAGVMLIFLIFVMLAAERRGEMGMARAVGTKRRHLIQTFVAEGAAYDLLAAAIGALAGVGVAFGMVGVLGSLLSGNVDGGFTIVPHVELRSLAIAYALGVVVTFLTIVVSSWRVSRLNIVAAIRDLDDAKKPGGTWRGLVVGIVGVGLGAFMAANAGTKAALFYSGVSLLILAATLILRRLRLPSRLNYTLAGGALVVFWGMPFSTSDRIFGKHDGGFEMFFISGLMMVAGAALLIINNADLLVGALNAVGGVASRYVPALKMGTAYPLTNRFRTGLTLYMFALIIFVLVMMAAMSANFDKFFNDPARTTGGWDVIGTVLPTSPIKNDDLRGALAANGVQLNDFTAIGGVAQAPRQKTQAHNANGAGQAGGVSVAGVSDDWLAQTGYHLQARAAGYADDAAVWQALRQNPNLAVVDSFLLQNAGPNRFTVAGIDSKATTFQPVKIELQAENGPAHELTVIGVTDTSVGDVGGLYINLTALNQVFGPQPVTNWFFKLRPGLDAKAEAHTLRAALLANGMQAQSIQEMVAQNNSVELGFFNLLEGFIALGLVVGIAALGVVSFRAVVERRQQIGMLRAIGFARSMVSLSFLIESFFITTLGIVAGTAMGAVLARNLFTSGGMTGGQPISFVIPWDRVGLFAVIALVAALLMTIVPARQAGRVTPAEALRFE